MASSLALSGVFSGIDTEPIIQRVLEMSRTPINRLEIQRGLWQAKDEAVATLETGLESLSSYIASLTSAKTLNQMSASSADKTIVTTTATSSAIAGSYSIEVNQLASSHRMVHTAGVSSLDERLGLSKSSAVNANTVADLDAIWFTTGANGATYSFDFGGEGNIGEVAFDANTTYSLNQVVAAINAQSQAAAGYDAASIDGSGPYALKLTAKDVGPAGELTHVLTAGDAIAVFDEEADWAKTDGEAGAFSYTYGGTTRTITTVQGTTFQDLLDMINNDAENPGVTASALQYDSTYHLILSGNQTGADNAITINDGLTTLAFDTADFTETQTAANSRLRIDGFPDGAWIERSSNSVADVLPGMTLNLQKAGTATVTVSRQTSQLKSDLSNLAVVYNDLVDKIKSYTGTETGGLAGALKADVTIVRLLDQVRSAITAAGRGFESGSDTFTSAADIGLSFGSGAVSVDETSGENSVDVTKLAYLSFDEATFDAAMQTDAQGVIDLIGAVGKGVSDDSGRLQFVSSHNQTEGGTYSVQVTYDAAGVITSARIRKDGETEYRDLNISDNELTGAYGNPEQYLMLRAIWDGSGAYTDEIEVRVRQGFAWTLGDSLDSILDDYTGVIASKRDQYENAIDRIEQNIEAKEANLVIKEENLRAKYARMEAALAQLDAQRGAFEALMSSLESNKKDD